MGQFGLSMSFLDTIIIALGNTKMEESLPVIITMAKVLSPDHEFSHFRAVSMAFETIGNKAAAPVLFDLLNMNGVAGHYVITQTEKHHFSDEKYKEKIKRPWQSHWPR